MLTRVERNLLDTLGQCPTETMFQVEAADRAGYGTGTTRKHMRQLRHKGLVHWPRGPRKGVALTAKGVAMAEVSEIRADTKARQPTKRLHVGRRREGCKRRGPRA